MIALSETSKSAEIVTSQTGEAVVEWQARWSALHAMSKAGVSGRGVCEKVLTESVGRKM